MADITDLIKAMEPNERATMRTFMRIRDALVSSEYYDPAKDADQMDAIAASLTNAVALRCVEDAIIGHMPA